MSLTLFYFIQNTLIFIILGWAIYLVFRNGQLYYIPITTMAISAYFVAFVTRDWGWSWALATIVALCIGGFFAFLPALGLAKAPDFTMVVATIGVLIIITTIIRNLGFLGGEMGLGNIPEVPNIMVKTIIIFIVIGIFVYRIDHSRIGRAMSITFVEKDVASTLGINLFWMSVWLQVVAGAMGGISGALYAATMPNMQIYSFSFETVLLLVCFIFVGGYSTMWGLVIATPVLYGFPLVLPDIIADWRYIIYGIMLIVILALRPEGAIDKIVIKKVITLLSSLIKRRKSHLHAEVN